MALHKQYEITEQQAALVLQAQEAVKLAMTQATATIRAVMAGIDDLPEGANFSKVTLNPPTVHVVLPNE